ncbi:MAG: hypothetical protein V7752_13340 [Halopseudomonas sp.]
MAKSSKLRVMISSRCLDYFPLNQAETTLSDVRKVLKTDIEAMEIAGKKAFDVWINEETDPQGGTWDSWDVCLQAVQDADIVLVLSNGSAGWAKSGEDIGICHAELMKGLSIAPAKMRLIDLGKVSISNDDDGKRNKNFQDYVNQQSLFRGGVVKTVDDLKHRVKEALYDAVIKLAQSGVSQASKGKFSSGAALDWSRLDFQKRQQEMTSVLRKSLEGRSGSKVIDEKVLIALDNQKIFVRAHAIPEALTVAAAKEMVGQPFLEDHLHANTLISNKCGGPLHIIACHRTATESQARKLLGFPDATVVSTPFGVFVADNIQKIQFVFIVNCRDESTTRHGVQRFFEWLEQTREDALIAKRAKSRASIVKAIAKEIA